MNKERKKERKKKKKMKCVNASKMSSARLVEERDKLVGSGRYHATRHEARLRFFKEENVLSSSLYNIK